MKRRIATLVAGACLAGVVIGGPAAESQAATCYTPDGIGATSYVSGVGVTRISGTVYYSGSRSGSYTVTLSDLARNSHDAKLFVQFFPVGGTSWIERVDLATVADGGSARTVTRSFSKGYNIDMIAFGTGQVGSPNYTLAWDRNSPCGA